MARYVERPFWRGDGVPTTSSMVEEICGFVKRFQALEGEERAWAQESYAAQQGMSDFLFQVNAIEGEGFDSVEETRQAASELQEEQQADDHRMEAVRGLNQAFRLWWEEEEAVPSIANWKLLKSHDLLMASSNPDIAGMFRAASDEACTITSRGTQHFYTSPWAIKLKLGSLVSKTNSELQRMLGSHDDLMTTSRIEQLLVLATDFFYKFECIHPFVDGNGRCGRIMLAYLLRSITMVVPNVLFVAAGHCDHQFVDRNIYLDCFENAREDDNDPRDLTSLVIEGVYFGWKRFFAALRDQQPNKVL